MAVLVRLMCEENDEGRSAPPDPNFFARTDYAEMSAAENLLLTITEK